MKVKEKKKKWLEKCKIFSNHVFVCLTLKYFHSLCWFWSQCVMMTAELSAPLVKHWSYCISWLASLIRNNYTQKTHAWILKSSKTRPKTYQVGQFHYLVAPHPVARSYFHTSPIGMPHTVNAVTGIQTPDLQTLHGPERDTTTSKVSLSLCVCRYWPPPIPHSSEAKGNVAGYHRLFPPWTTWSSCIYVPPWHQDNQFYLHHELI